ncbi:hypothetical protein AVEN_189753-1 [Araneus ventricosus]|uniref:Kynurenine formamidase n=1 Tax=Araneus ventricosus TaxID=182803 RepID=A0A4Y2RE50_ARAVE|nr:hypothetical protein AVEN_189753-1 [Araneus ventricosus]
MILFLLLLHVTEEAMAIQHMIDMTYTFDESLDYLGVKKFEMTIIINQTHEDGYWSQLEEYSASIHLGTHMDAPAHMSKGGQTIEQIPVERFIVPAAVIDITEKAETESEAEAAVEDLLHWESISEQTLNGTIVMLKFGWGEKWNNKSAFFGTASNDLHKLCFPGLAPDAAAWLVENRDIYGIATEAASFDKGSTKTFPAHQILLGKGIYGLENVANIDKIPVYGAKLYVFPMKIGKASGAPVRIIAIYEDDFGIKPSSRNRYTHDKL